MIAMADLGGRVVNRLRHLVVPEATVLLYHRVADVRPDPWSLSVSPRHFAEHMEVLRRRCRPTRLQELVQGLRDGRPVCRTVVVTFDDGYADNLTNAQPILEYTGMPATIFVATGKIDHGGEFWSDELCRLLLQPGLLPPLLELRIGSRNYRWELGESARYSVADARRYAEWIAWGFRVKAPTARHALYRSLWEVLLPLNEGARQAALDQIRRWAGVTQVNDRSRQMLDPNGVSALARDGLIEIGAHTVTHPSLAVLPAIAQRDEIQGCKSRLEEILERPVINFSYPYGRRCDYTPETIAIVREAGFHCACSSFAGTVGRSTDPFQLPRYRVPDCDGDVFEWKFASMFAPV
jgi:peptidoglycan/xylan/chitin deacetylase (PgdA/CDA1 family)